jgi:hypothetical protein
VRSVGSESLDDGFGVKVAVGGRWVALSQSDEGIMLVDLGSLVDSELELEVHSLPLPVGCAGDSCETANAIALAGADRAIVTTNASATAGQRAHVYLVDISLPSAWDIPEGTPPPPGVVDDVIAVVDVSDPDAQASDVFVSGSRAYVAAQHRADATGTVDVLEIGCP